MLDMSGNLVNWNKVAETVSGLSAKELTGKPIVELFAEEDRTAVADAIRKGLEEGIGEVTGSFLRKGRSPAIYQWSTVPLKDPQGKVIGLTGVGRDITEHKRIEEELARIAAEQKNIMGTISDGIYMLDMSGNLVNWNKAAEVVTGLSAEELMDKPAVELFAEEDRAAVADAIRKGLEEGIGEVTGSFLRKGRSPAIYQWSTVPLKDPQGKVIGLTGVGRDITERKRAEKALRESETQIRTIYEAAKNVSFIMTGLAGTEAHILEFSPGAEAIFGYRGEEVIGKPVSILHLPEDVAKFPEVIESMRQRKVGFTGESTLVRKSGEKFPALFTTYPLFDVEGKMTATLGVSIDITKRKQATEALRISESQKRAILDGITTNIAFVNENLEILWVNKASAISVGKLPEEMIGHKCYEFWADPEKPCDGCPTLKAWKTRKSEHAIMTTPDGRVWDEGGEPVFDQDGELIGIVEIASDITKRVQAEKALRESNENYQQVVSNITTVVWKADIRNNETFENTYTSPVVDELLGLPAGTIQNDWGKYFSYIKPEYLERVNNAFREAIMLPGKKIDCEYEVLKENEQTAWFYSKGRCFEKNGKLHVFGSTTDITEQKKAEEKIKAKSHFLESLIQQSPLPTFVMDSKGFNVMVNEAFLKFYAVPGKELILGRNALTEPANVSQGMVKYFEEALSGKIVEVPEIEFVSPYENKKNITRCRMFPIVDPTGTLTNVVVMQEDITEQKQAEKSLKASEEKYRQLAETSKDVIMVLDLKGNVKYINQEGIKLSGHSKEEILKMNVNDVLLDDKIPLSENNLAKRIAGDKSLFVYEIDFLNKKGDKIPVEIKSSLITEQSKPAGVLITARDVTERKRAEDKIKASLKEKEVLLREIHHRVKNNLQVISSLLNMQVRKAKDKNVIDSLLNSRSRIQTMSLIHAQLYQSENFEQVEMGTTIRKLLSFLSQIYAGAKKNITSVVTAEGVILSISQAIPCGLIINELVSNALKHAFNGMAEGSIEISMRELADDKIKLTVKDNGVGIPEELDIYKTDTLGLKIVRTLAEEQLEGKMGLIREKGTEICVEFDKSITN
jgi:PAS domain S-box-containing protein